MDDPEESLIRPLVRPFVLMLAFYLALDPVIGFILRIPGKLGLIPPEISPWGGWEILRIGMLFLAGVLFIRCTGGKLRNHGFTLREGKRYILPAFALGIGTAAILAVIFLPPMLQRMSDPYLLPLSFPPRQSGPPAAVRLILFPCLAGMHSAVTAFLVCSVMQEFISKRADRCLHFLRREIRLAGLAAALIPVLAAVIRATGKPGFYGPTDPFFLYTVFSGMVALVYTYWYDRSRSLAAPAISGFLYGTLASLVFHVPFLIPRG